MTEKKRTKTTLSAITNKDAAKALYDFVKTSPHPYIILEESGKIVLANTALDRLLLCRENNYAGLALVSLVAPAFRQKYFDLFRDFFNGTLTNGTTIQLIRENGPYLPVTLYRHTEIAIENKGRQCIVAICADLSEEHVEERVATRVDQIERKYEEQIRSLQTTLHERERTDKTFREMQERQTLAFWGADMAWWEYAIPSDIFIMSSRVSQILGDIYSPGSVPADDLLEYIYEDDREKVLEAIRDHKEGKTSIVDVRIRVISHSCVWKWVLLRGRITEYGENNTPLRMVGIIQDINETKQFEDEHSLFFKHATDMFTVLDQNGILQNVNPAVEKHLGWSAQEMIGIPAITFTHPDDINNANKALELLSQSKVPPPVEQRVRCKDGTYRWLSTNVVPLPDHGVSIGIGRDITEQKTQQILIQEINASLEQRVAERSAELERREQMYRTLFALSPMPIFVANASTGTLIDANDRALEYIGVSFDDLKKMHFTELHDTASLELVQSTFKSISTGGRLLAITARLRHNSGTYRRVMIHTRAVVCDDAVYAVAVMTDLEE